jgi:hypothetical protein
MPDDLGLHKTHNLHIITTGPVIEALREYADSGLFGMGGLGEVAERLICRAIVADSQQGGFLDDGSGPSPSTKAEDSPSRRELIDFVEMISERGCENHDDRCPPDCEAFHCTGADEDRCAACLAVEVVAEPDEEREAEEEEAGSE